MAMNAPEPENADTPVRTGWNPVDTLPVAPVQPVSPAVPLAPVGTPDPVSPASPAGGDQAPDGMPQGGDDEEVIKPENWHQD